MMASEDDMEAKQKLARGLCACIRNRAGEKPSVGSCLPHVPPDSSRAHPSVQVKSAAMPPVWVQLLRSQVKSQPLQTQGLILVKHQV